MSPDGKWVLGRPNTTPAPLTRLPMGVGEMKPLIDDGLNHVRGGWLPDGKRIVFTGNEPGHALRLYVESAEGGKPTAISPEGVGPRMILSRKGDFVAGTGIDHKVYLYPIAGGEPRLMPGLGSRRNPNGMVRRRSLLICLSYRRSSYTRL